MPTISVIVPVYKAEAYLHQCVDSILAQTFSDFEVFLVDDGSPDNCGAICEEYKAKDSRIHVLHQENRGQAAARNHALPLTTGRWLCYVDSDDAIHPRMLELLYDAVRDSGAGVSICPMVRDVQMPEDFHKPATGKTEVLTADEQMLVKLYDAGEYPAWEACAKLIRRDLAEGYPFREGRVYEDNEAVCRWVCGAGKLARVQDGMYYYRTNPVSTTQRSFSLKKRDYLWALDSIIRYSHSLGYHTLTERFCGLYVEEAAGQYRRIGQELADPEARDTVKKDALSLAKAVPMTMHQREILLDAFHPKLIRYYWPVAGAVRAIKNGGASGLAEKLKKNLRKGGQR